jgi:class 3 adenylate cyclase
MGDCASREAARPACAVAITDAAQRLGLRPRSGVHTREIEQRDRHISGIATQIAMQIAALGGPDEVLVSRTVKDLVAGSGLRFADPATHSLDAIAEDWPLFRSSKTSPSASP